MDAEAICNVRLECLKIVTAGAERSATCAVALADLLARYVLHGTKITAEDLKSVEDAE